MICQSISAAFHIGVSEAHVEPVDKVLRPGHNRGPIHRDMDFVLTYTHKGKVEGLKSETLNFRMR